MTYSSDRAAVSGNDTLFRSSRGLRSVQAAEIQEREDAPKVRQVGRVGGCQILALVFEY